VNAGVASHTSAAGLHRLGDLLDDTPELTVPYRKQSRRGIRIHRMSLADSDITFVDGLPTTTQERTVADLLRDGHDPDHVAQIIGQGVRRGVIDLTSLTAHLEPLARRHGQSSGLTLVEHLLDLVGLSPAALARELASSPAGHELVAVGRSAAFADVLASLVPQINALEMLNLGKIDPAKTYPREARKAPVVSDMTTFVDAVAFVGAFLAPVLDGVASGQRWLTSEHAWRQAERDSQALS